MSQIEQAIYTSARTTRADGYQIVSQSPAAKDADLREIAAWAPSHDSLVDSGPTACSVNFHPLSSGAFCVSRTTAEWGEFSGRGGERVYTQALIVPADVLRRFSDNPFALLTAATALGAIAEHETPPQSLEAIRLSGRAAAADAALLAQLGDDPGPAWIAAILQGVLTSQVTAVVAGENRRRIVAGVVNTLPVDCRVRVSFSTGLKYSPRRPFRLMGLDVGAPDQVKVLRRIGATVLDLADKSPRELVVDAGWAGFVSSAMAAEKIGFLASQVGQPRPGLGLEQLDSLGKQLREALADAPASPGNRPTGLAGRPREATVGAPARETFPPTSRAEGAHARHVKKETSTAAAPIDDSPAHAVGWQCPAALAQLEPLDDLVFEAIAGKQAALQQLREAWPAVLKKLGPALVEESREHYIRHALKVWRECVDGDQIRYPALAIAAMDVVCLLCNA